MPDETTGQEPTAQDAPQPQDGGGADDQIAKLRQEAAKWRTQLRDAQAQLAELTPKAAKLDELEEARKTEAEKLAERIAKLEGELQTRQAEADAAVKRSQVLILASKAGVDPEVVDMLDLSKLDVSDKDSTIAKLRRLAPPARSGNMANPPRTDNAETSDEELRRIMFGGRRPTIFGGN